MDIHIHVYVHKYPLYTCDMYAIICIYMYINIHYIQVIFMQSCVCTRMRAMDKEEDRDRETKKERGR